MTKINLEGIASKMSRDQMKNVLGGSGSGKRCSCDKNVAAGQCNGPGKYTCTVNGTYVGCTNCTGVPDACDGCM